MWRSRRGPYAEYPATDAIRLTIGAVLLAAGLLVWTVDQGTAEPAPTTPPTPAPPSASGGSRGQAAAERLAAVRRLYLDGVTVGEQVARRLDLPPKHRPAAAHSRQARPRHQPACRW
jgi:hypothetical protein